MRPEPIVRWPTSELPIWPTGSPTASPDAASCACGKSRQSRSKTGVSASSTALPGPGGAIPQPSRMTSATRGSCGLAYGAEGVDVERCAADERSVDVGLREQACGVVRLDRAAVQHRHVEERLDEGVRVLGHLRRRAQAGADRPDGLVRDDEALVLREGGDLAAEHVLRLVGLALFERLADARDDAEPCGKRGLGATRDALVGLAEELAPLGVADERAGDAELDAASARRSRR